MPWEPQGPISQALLKQVIKKISYGIGTNQATSDFVFDTLLPAIQSKYGEDSASWGLKGGQQEYVVKYYRFELPDAQGNLVKMKRLKELVQHISDNMLPIKELWDYADKLADQLAEEISSSSEGGEGESDEGGSDEDGSDEGDEGGDAPAPPATPAAARGPVIDPAAAAAGGGCGGATSGERRAAAAAALRAAGCAAAGGAGGGGNPRATGAAAAAAGAGAGGTTGRVRPRQAPPRHSAAAAAAAGAGGGGPSPRKRPKRNPARGMSTGSVQKAGPVEEALDLTQNEPVAGGQHQGTPAAAAAAGGAEPGMELCSHRGCVLAGRPVGFCKYCKGPVCIDEMCADHCPNTGGIGSNDTCAHCRNPFGVLARTTCTACPMRSAQIHSGDTCRQHPAH